MKYFIMKGKIRMFSCNSFAGNSTYVACIVRSRLKDNLLLTDYQQIFMNN